MNKPPTRRYHSPRRQEGAQRTRQAILEAARRLFATHGYAATTLPAIAREAGVSAPTVTAVFGTKAALLDALIGLVVRGDAHSAPMVERSWWQKMLEEPDPTELLRMYAATTCRIQQRSADIAEIVRGAATADPEIAAVLRSRGDRRLQDVRGVAEALASRGVLKPGLSIEDATDVLWAMGSADMYRLLVVERAWPLQKYEHWLASSLIDYLLHKAA